MTTQDKPKVDPRPVLHSTYFKLKDNTAASRESYMATCNEYLSSSAGMLTFWMGERDETMHRPVNDLAFDVAMHQVFASGEAFDHYNGSDPRHEQFVSEVDRWAVGTERRVYDMHPRHMSFGDVEAHCLTEMSDDGTLPAPLMHSLYFTLNDPTEASVEKLIQICQDLLSNHPGQLFFSAGTVANPLDRPINVTDFNVAVDMVWASHEAHERYAASPRHKEFFPATEGTLAKTAVFDENLRYEKNARTYANG